MYQKHTIGHSVLNFIRDLNAKHFMKHTVFLIAIPSPFFSWEINREWYKKDNNDETVEC